MLLYAVAALAQSPNPEAEPTRPAIAALGELAFDIRLPAEIELDGQTLVKTFGTGRYTTDAVVGAHRLRVYLNGRPHSLDIEVTDVARTTVMIGRNGLSSTNELIDLPDESGLASVEFRVLGREDLTLVLGAERTRLVPGKRHRVELPVGEHEIAVRNGHGTVVWASGTLSLTQARPVVVQLTEGRMPEVSGSGSSFHSR